MSNLSKSARTGPGAFLAPQNLFGRPMIQQFVKFGMVGVLNTAIDFLTLNFLTYATNIYQGNGLIPLNGAAFLAATAHSYFWNRAFVFGRSGTSHTRFLPFLVITLTGGLLNTLVLRFAVDLELTTGLSRLQHLNAAKLMATAVSMVWNFLGYKFFVFRAEATSGEPVSHGRA